MRTIVKAALFFCGTVFLGVLFLFFVGEFFSRADAALVERMHAANVSVAVAQEMRYSEEKLRDALGQMMIIGFEGTELTPELLTTLHEIRPGGVLLLGRNIENAEQTKKLIADLQRVSGQMSGYPLFVAVDQEGTPINRVFWADTKTAQSDLEGFEDAYKVARARAGELKELGFNLNLAPVLDSRTPEDYLFSRSLQKDIQGAYDVVRGLVWGHKAQGVLVVPKHFPGYDGIPYDPEEGVIPSLERVPNPILFQNVFTNTNQQFVMASHVVYEEIDAVHPFPFSSEGIEFLRETLSDEVFVVSDDLISESFVSFYHPAEIGAHAIHSGINILLLAGYEDPEVIGDLHKHLLSLVMEDEELQRSVISSSERIQNAKKSLLR